MNLRQIEVFRAFMIAGTVVGAAELLRVTQPGVSKLLKHIEETLGARLFERDRGRLVPTPEAYLLFREIEVVWPGVGRVQRLARDLKGASQQIRIVTTPSLGATIIPNAVAILLRLRPELRFNIELMSGPLLLEALVNNAADVGIAIGDACHPNLRSETIATGRLTCIMPEGHRLAGKRDVDIDDLAEVPLVALTDETTEGALLRDSFMRAGVEPLVAVQVRSSPAASWFVSRGAGVAVVDEFLIHAQPGSGIVGRPFTPAPRFNVTLVMPRDRPASQAVRDFGDVLRKQWQTVAGAVAAG